MSKNNVCGLMVVLFTIIAFFSVTGVISSNYHFTDDHQMLSISNSLEVNSLLDVVINRIKQDLSVRFRPMYWVQRVLIVKCFGLNYLAFSLYTASLCVLTITFIYYGCIRLGFSVYESILFLIITFAGPQMAIWWRLGPNETCGMLFLSLSFLFIKPVKPKDTINNILFGIFVILASWCKESITLAIPAMVFLRLALLKQMFKITLKNMIVNNFVLFIPLVVFIANTLLIVFYVGTNNIGYAGIDGGMLKTLGELAALLLSENIVYYEIYTILMLIFAFMLINEKTLALLRRIVIPLLFFGMIFLPNCLLYAKSGIFERYYLPSTFAFAFIIISTLKAFKKSRKPLYYILSLTIIILSFPLSCEAFQNARKYSEKANEIKNFMNCILEESNEQTKILLTANPVSSAEWSVALDKFMKHNDFKNLYAYDSSDGAIDSKFKEGLKKGWYKYFEKRMYENMSGMPDLIVAFNSSEIKTFLKKLVNQESYYNVYGGAEFSVYMPGHVLISPEDMLFTTNYDFKQIDPASPSAEIQTNLPFTLLPGDMVEVKLIPSTPIYKDVKAYFIMYQLPQWGKTMIFHDAVIVNGEVGYLSKTIDLYMEKPTIIWRNWGVSESIPPTRIIIKVFRKTEVATIESVHAN